MLCRLILQSHFIVYMLTWKILINQYHLLYHNYLHILQAELSELCCELGWRWGFVLCRKAYNLLPSWNTWCLVLDFRPRKSSCPWDEKPLGIGNVFRPIVLHPPPHLLMVVSHTVLHTPVFWGALRFVSHLVKNSQVSFFHPSQVSCMSHTVRSLFSLRLVILCICFHLCWTPGLVHGRVAGEESIHIANYACAF